MGFHWVCGAIACLLVTGCAETVAELDAGRDAGPLADAGSSDAGSTPDGGIDAGAPIDAGTDAGVVMDAGSDAGLALDAGTDAGAIGTGQCDETRCTPTCFRAYTCVLECGGPEANCGCCQCAAGSIDSITCGGPPG